MALYASFCCPFPNSVPCVSGFCYCSTLLLVLQSVPVTFCYVTKYHKTQWLKTTLSAGLAGNSLSLFHAVSAVVARLGVEDADKLVLAVGFSPHGPHHRVVLLPHTWSLVSKSECPKKQEVETASFLSLGPRNWYSVISTIDYWPSITEIDERDIKEFGGHVLKLPHSSKGLIVYLLYFTF